MITKAVIIVFMLIILISLGSGLYYLIVDKDRSDRTVKALTWRIGLSVCLFALLFIGFAMGLIQPHGLNTQSEPVHKNKQE
jgi:hypothetical protein